MPFLGHSFDTPPPSASASVQAHADPAVLFCGLQSYALRRLVALAAREEPYTGPKLFPTATHTYFVNGLGEDDILYEYDWIAHLLKRFPERGSPAAFEPLLQSLLKQDHVLAAWPACKHELIPAAEVVKNQIKSTMNLDFARHPDTLVKSDYWRDPVIYETKTASVRALWQRALDEAQSQLTAPQQRALLEIHAFVKDPIGSLHPDSTLTINAQADIFNSLWAMLQSNKVLGHVVLTPQLAAQLAYESSYLALADLSRVAFTVVNETEQLAYIYADIDTLPRAEFSRPDRLFAVMQELVASMLEHNSELLLPPIAVAKVPSLDRDRPAFPVIIDGNNRTTSTCLLRFLAGYASPELVRAADLDAYCRARGLGPKWLCDLREGLAAIEAQDLLAILRPHWATVRQFADIQELPALLVQEENFMTMCMRAGTRDKPVLMQPVHQSIYNDDRFCASFRAKAGQAHGKSRFYPLLPARRRV